MSVYTWSLTAASNATSDAGINWAEGQSPSTVNNSARAMMAAIKAGLNDVAGVSALGGAGDTFTLSLSQPMASLTNAIVGFFATRTNTGAVTLNVDALGAKPLRLTSGVALAAGQIVSGSFYQCAYDTTNLEWIIIGHYLVSNSDMAAMADQTVKGNLSGASASPSDVSVSSLSALILTADSVGTATIADGSITFLKLATALVSTVAEFLSNTANKALSVASLWGGAAVVTIADAATITLNFSTFINGKITIAGNRTLAISNGKVGQSGIIEVYQDATGSRTLSYTAGSFVFASGTEPTLTTTASARDLLGYQILSDGKVLITCIRAVA